jgi:hypothetical protein
MENIDFDFYDMTLLRNGIFLLFQNILLPSFAF